MEARGVFAPSNPNPPSRPTPRSIQSFPLLHSARCPRSPAFRYWIKYIANCRFILWISALNQFWCARSVLGSGHLTWVRLDVEVGWNSIGDNMRLAAILPLMDQTCEAVRTSSTHNEDNENLHYNKTNNSIRIKCRNPSIFLTSSIHEQQYINMLSTNFL